MKRPSFESILMNFAESFAKRSHDPKIKVGAVICTTDFKNLSVGFNGLEAKGKNKRDSMVKGKSGSVHGELNSLINCTIPSYIDKYMFVTHAPCKVCARAIVNAGGFKKLYYKHLYKPNGLTILKERGIEVIKM